MHSVNRTRMKIGLKIMNDNKKPTQVYKNKLMKEMVKIEQMELIQSFSREKSAVGINMQTKMYVNIRYEQFNEHQNTFKDQKPQKFGNMSLYSYFI